MRTILNTNTIMKQSSKVCLFKKKNKNKYPSTPCSNSPRK